MREKIKNKKPKPKYILYIQRRKNECQILGFLKINELLQYARLVQKSKPSFLMLAYEWNEDRELRDSCHCIIDDFDSLEVNAELSGYYKPKKK